MAQVKANNFHLIPCPFDGGFGDSLGLVCRNGGLTFNYNESDEEWCSPRHDATVVVVCSKCQCEGPIADFTIPFNLEDRMTPAEWDFLRAQAVRLWNTRAFIAAPGIKEIREAFDSNPNGIFVDPQGVQEAHPRRFNHQAKIGTGASTKIWLHPMDLTVVGSRIRFRDLADGKPFYRADEWDTGVLEKFVDTDMMMIERM